MQFTSVRNFVFYYFLILYLIICVSDCFYFRLVPTVLNVNMSASKNVHKAVATSVCYHVTQETALFVYRCFVFDVIAEAYRNTLNVSSGHLLIKIHVII